MAALIGGLLVGALGGLLRRRLVRFEVVEDSMSPTLQEGDYVIARRIGTAPRRGDIVIFPHPTRSDFDLVKRVVGLPGDSIDVSSGQVHVNGRVLAEPWADGPTLPAGEWKLNPDEVFVLGDNRARSGEDGRTLGGVPLSSVRWNVVLRYWPPGRVGRIVA